MGGTLVVIRNTGPLRPTFEDILRAIGYLTLVVWGVMFLCFPPDAYINTVDIASRLSWMGIGILGSSLAVVGSLTRIDIKLEFPGILLALIAPLFYSAAQVYFSIYPLVGTNPTSRFALAVYAIVPFFLMLPRAYALYAESRRLKRITVASSKAWALSHPDEVEQTGRAVSFIKKGV